MMNKTIRLSRGQSIAEALVFFLLVASFFVAIPWLGRLIDISLNQSHAASYGAFQLTRQLDGLKQDEIKQRFFIGSDKNWRDRQQNLLLSEKEIAIKIERDHFLSQHMQPGSDHEYAQALRKEWQIEDQGVANVSIQVEPLYSQSSRTRQNGLTLQLSVFDHLNPLLQRHTAILTDAGHSSSDQKSHERIAWSSTGWSVAATESYRLGKHIAHYAQATEGFNRAKPVFDWLNPWAGKIPQHHLGPRQPSERAQ